MKAITVRNINLKKTIHWAFTNRYVTQYHDKDLGIWRETVTRRSGEIGIGKSTERWYIGEDKKSYKSAELLIQAYNRERPGKRIG